MSEKLNVFTDLGEGRHTYKEIQDIGIITGPRCRPRMLDKGMNGYYLGLYDAVWAASSATPSGAETYFVQIVPTYSKVIDPDSEYLKGVPCAENTTKGVTFYFDPFPDGYACDGYEVWAGTVTGTLYYQGNLTDRFQTTFVIGTTWTYTSSGATLDALTIGPPAFADLVTVYQGEGEINSRVILAGGKKYTDGYAQVASVDTAPILTTATAGSSTVGDWNAVADGSFKVRIDNYVRNVTGMDFSSAADMDGVATLLQARLQSLMVPVLYGGTSPETSMVLWNAITDGSFNIFVDGVSYDIESLDFSSATDMDDVAAVIQVGLQASLSQADVFWDSVSGKFIITAYDTTGADQIVNGAFAADSDWTKDAEWTIAGGKATVARPGSNAVTNGTFATDTDWTKSAGTGSNTVSISGGKGRYNSVNTSTVGTLTQSITSRSNYLLKLDYTAPSGTWSIVKENSFPSPVLVALSSGSGQYKQHFTSASAQCFIRMYQSAASTEELTVDNAEMSYIADTSAHEMYQQKAAGSWNGASWSVAYTLSGMIAGNQFQIQFKDSSGNIGGTGVTRTADGTYSETITVGSDNTYNRIYLRDISVTESAYSVDNVAMIQVVDTDSYMSSLDRRTATGTDISEMMDCRPTSLTIFNTYKSKTTSTHTVAWSTDHFVFSHPDSGDTHRYSFLESADGNVGTDISGSSWLNGTSGSASTYVAGQTAKRSVLGNGTDWGDWAVGMKLRGAGEPESFLVKEVRSETELTLDSDYSGDLFNGWTEYTLEPYDDQVYISDLGNPFAYRIENIQKIPIEKSEGITTLCNNGTYTAIMLEESCWIIDSVDITSPLQCSPDDGCPNNEAAIPFNNGVAFYSGDDFKFLRGRNIDSLDPDDRMRDIIGRISNNAPYPMGIFLPSETANILVWLVGLDGSYVYNTAICYNPKTGAWWLWNLKDANCVTTLKDNAGNFYMATGSTYDDAHSVPSFIKLYSREYFNDGASQSTNKTKQGTLATGGIGAPSSISGYLTCGTAFSATYTDWTSITDGYLRVTIDDVDLDVGPVDFSTATSMADVATLLQTAIRAATGAGGAEVVAWSTDHFVITSGTTTNRSNVSYLRPYYPTVSTTDLSSVSYMNGRDGQATTTGAISTITLTLRNWTNDADAVIETSNDGEKGVYLAFCSPSGVSLQYALITANTANTVTVSPVPSTLPEAGWRWFIGGIVPTWFKWFDFGSPQHLQKMVSAAVTTDPNTVSARNYLHMLYYHDLKTTLRKAYTQQLGIDNDTVNTIEFRDREATQHGIKFIRPSSERDLVINDITLTHHPLV